MNNSAPGPRRKLFIPAWEKRIIMTERRTRPNGERGYQDQQIAETGRDPTQTEGDHPKRQLYFWEKPASKAIEDRYDRVSFHSVEDDPEIREVIRIFESRKMGKKLLFSDVSPRNPSVKKWINDVRFSYPKRKDDVVDDLLNAFRESLYPRSKEKYRLIVGLIVLNDVVLLLHCKKDPSLAEFKDRIYPVRLILHPKNVLRTAIIKSEDGKMTFSAFEYSRKWSKGHAEFWGIEPEDVSWESLGSVILFIGLIGFEYPILLPIEFKDLDQMMTQRRISPTGKITIGRQDGVITEVEVFRRRMNFSEFYSYYVLEKEKLEEHKREFKKLMDPQLNLDHSYEKGKFRYEEDPKRVYELTSQGRKVIYSKEHPRYVVCFFAPKMPGIKPTDSLIREFYGGIFDNRIIEVWHAGRESSLEPLRLGCLRIFNKFDVCESLLEFSDHLLNIIQDVESRKARLLLQRLFCILWKENVRCDYHSFMFESILSSIIVPELEFEFKTPGIFSKEEYLEFKSSDKVNPKSKKFAEELASTARNYVRNGELIRSCILYGIEENMKFKPLYHLANDQIAIIERIANEELSNDKIEVNLYPLPFKDGIILAVFLLPLFGQLDNKK